MASIVKAQSLFKVALRSALREIQIGTTRKEIVPETVLWRDDNVVSLPPHDHILDMIGKGPGLGNTHRLRPVGFEDFGGGGHGAGVADGVGYVNGICHKPSSEWRDQQPIVEARLIAVVLYVREIVALIGKSPEAKLSILLQ